MSQHTDRLKMTSTKYRNLALILLLTVWLSGLHAQSQITVHTASTDVFKADYLFKQSYDYNPDFIRLHNVKSIKLYSELMPDEAMQDRFFTQYNFNEWGTMSEKFYFRETEATPIPLILHKFFYNDDEQIDHIEVYYEGKFAATTWFVYKDGQLESVFEEDDNGKTGNHSEYLISKQRINQKTTYSNNIVRQLEYHLPVSVLLENPDTLRQMQSKDSRNKRTYFYLYENDKIINEFWYTPVAVYDISREYDRNGQLSSIKQVGNKTTTTATYRYGDTGNIKRIKINRTKQAAKQRRFFYDEADVFILRTEVKRSGEVLESLIYEYEFW